MNRKLVVAFLAIWTQTVLVGIPCVLWGWRGLAGALIGWTVVVICFELGKTEVRRAQTTGTEPQA